MRNVVKDAKESRCTICKSLAFWNVHECVALDAMQLSNTTIRYTYIPSLAESAKAKASKVKEVYFK